MTWVERSIITRAIRYGLRKVKERRQHTQFHKRGSQLRNELQSKLNELRKYNPDRIFVVGNGPSLKKQNLELLCNDFTICSNAFYHAYGQITWRPTILTIEDPLPAKDNARFFEDDTDSLKLVPYDLRTIIRNTKSTAYINFLRSYSHWSRSDWPRFSHDIVSCAYWGGTVSFLALQIAATLKPSQIILIGTDLTYVVPKTAIKNGTILTSTESDPNHFHPEYFGAGKRWHIPETDRMQRAFQYADHALSAENIELINATEGGNLRNIKRRNYNELFE